MFHTILPTPKTVNAEKESVRILPHISFDAVFSGQAEAFCSSVQRLFSADLSEGEGGVVLVSDPSLTEESYTLDVTEDGMILHAGDAHGMAFALATALQCLQGHGEELFCRKLHIEDRPDKEYRGLMVDLARDWHPLNTLKKYVDVCFLLKVKYLHLHFIDMERYSLPSKAFPKIGGGREQYTEEDIRLLNEYALERGIVIIPEFEAPGHAASLTRTYPEVFANRIPDGKDGRIETEVGVLSSDSVLCPGKKECMDGIKTLLTEMCELFPHSPYIHIGGDEAAYPAWDHCVDCVAYMKEHGISDAHELYSEFVGRVAQMVLDLGRTPIVWEGFPEKGVHYIPKQTIIIAWESLYMLAPEFLKHGFKIINGSWKPLYIVDNPSLRWGPKEIMEWDVYNWQNWWEKSAAFLNPIRVSPTEDVLGAQISSWGCTYDQDISRVVEHLCALTERTWNVRRLHNDEAFGARMKDVARTAFRLIQDR
ncbi:MAG: family 20 glycosylhydrolase [Clostridia bacterium]|nr:family 20 glycosylhydrolase [Clostridia bacterium]